MADLKLNGKWKFSKIYKAVWESKISCKGKLVFAALEWYGDKKFPSHTTLALMCSLSVAGVKRAVKELQTAGLLSKETRVGQTNNYELFPEGDQVHLDLGQGDPGQKKPKSDENPGQGDLHNETLKINETIPAPGKPDALAIGKQFTEWWVDIYQKRFGKKYFFQGAKDGMAVKRLAGHYDFEALKALVVTGWNIPDRKDFSTKTVCMTISGFSSMVNQITATIDKSVAKKLEPGGPQDIGWLARSRKEREEEEKLKRTS